MVRCASESAAGWRRRLTVAAVLGVLAGLVWMHGLTGGGHAPPSVASVHAAAEVDPCAGHDGPGRCPDDGHRMPVCESGAPPVPFHPPVPVSPPLPIAPGSVPAEGVSPAVDAGAGTGCGPPSLTMLQISRT